MKGALALLITGGTENWAPGRWRERFKRVGRELEVARDPSNDRIDRLAGLHRREIFECNLAALGEVSVGDI